jgi:positive phototaxis protein PixI
MNSFHSAAPNSAEQRSYQSLSFHLTPQVQALLPTLQLAEVINLEASQIVPVFDLPEAVMGICNHRGEVLWIVDLACLLGFDTLASQNCRQFYSVLVIHHMQSHVGVAVRQVGQLVICSAARIQPLPSAMVLDMVPKLAFCLKGLYPLPDQRTEAKALLVLDGEKILHLLKRG